MLTIENRLYGQLVLAATGVCFAYYTVWVIGLPFVDDDFHDVFHAFFPPVEFALGIPAFIASVVFVGLFLRAYFLVRSDRLAEAERRRQR